MKRFIVLNLNVFLIISIVFSSCSGGEESTSASSVKDEDSISNQELELPQNRIVYQIPQMNDVICHKDIVYHIVNDQDLKADIYMPPNIEKSTELPLVILVNDYPDSVINDFHGRDQKDMGLFVSWAELLAASGMVAVTYQTQFSHSESDSLISFLERNADEYRIDLSRLAVFGASANTLAAQSLMQNKDYNIKCAILYYGILLTPDQKYYSEIDSSANMYGFYWSDLRKITEIPESIPLFVTRAGNDQFQIVTKTTEHFVSEAMKSNAHMTYINYPAGQHDFDILDNTEVSRYIIRQTIDFLKTYLVEQ